MFLKKLVLVAAAALGLAGCSTTSENGSSASQSQIDELTNKVGDRVFFEFDNSSLSTESKEVLKRQAQFMADHPELSFNIEGHCDMRGTREYNIGLGERRASQASDFLKAQGVNANRLDVVSYGKERPAVSGDSELDHAQNRRAVTVAK